MRKNSISYWTPDWVLTAIYNRLCSECNSKFTKSDIVAVGMREVNSGVAMYVEHLCKSCGYRAITTLGRQKEESLEEMCYTLLEGIKRKKIAHRVKELRKKQEGKMTDKEVKSMINFIQKAETHEEFLDKMGETQPPKKQNDKD